MARGPGRGKVAAVVPVRGEPHWVTSAELEWMEDVELGGGERCMIGSGFLGAHLDRWMKAEVGT
jgi:hypothetical protein